MERRPDPTIPAILWLCAAAVVHSLSYQGASTLADVGIGKSDLRAFAAAVRQEFHPQDSPMEVSFVSPLPDDPEAKVEEPRPDEPKVDPKQPDKKPEAKKPDEKRPDEKKPDEKKITLKLPELKPEPKKPDEKKPEPPRPDEPKPPPDADRRVAVRQHVEKNQADNPSAQFIADDANTVKEQTRATITAHGQDSSKPTLGSSEGPSKDVGNADHSRVADADDHAGDDRAPPGEKASQTSPLPKAPPATQVRPGETKPNDSPAPRSGDNGRPGPKAAPAPAPPTAAPPAPTAPTDQKPAPSPDTKNDPKGSYVINPFQGGSDDVKPGATASAVASAGPPPKPYVLPGLGGAPGPKGISFNLSSGAAIAAIGVETIRRDRELDGQRRRTAHRGSFKTQSFDKWRPAIENYVASVKPGNQTALNTAAVPFASYLQMMHERIHPMFADEFLDSLTSLPPTHELNRPLRTSLEIILDGQTGAIVKMGITRTSGVTAFDVGALSATERAAGKGFGKAPTAILSPDGNVYLHWEYHRNPDVACSNKNARPILLKTAPGGATSPLPGPRVPEVPREGGTPATPTR